MDEECGEGKLGLSDERDDEPDKEGVVIHRDKYWSISDNYAASREAMHHTAITAAEYDDGDGFDTAAWAAASDDEDAQEFQDNR